MKITTYHDHDVGSFLHAGALAFTHTPELTPQTTAGADVVMQSRKNREWGIAGKGKDGGLGSRGGMGGEAGFSAPRLAKATCSGRNDGVWVGGRRKAVGSLRSPRKCGDSSLRSE